MSQPNGPQPNSMGLKGFNQTGRNDTTTEVLKPKGNPANTQRNIILIAAGILACCVAGYFAYSRSGVDFNSIMKDQGHGLSSASEVKQDTEKSE